MIKKFTWLFALLPALLPLNVSAQGNFFTVNATTMFTVTGTGGGGSVTNSSNFDDANCFNAVTITAPNTFEQWGIGSNFFNTSGSLNGTYYVGVYISSVAAADTATFHNDATVESMYVPATGSPNSVETSFFSFTITHWVANGDGTFRGNIFFIDTPGNDFNGMEFYLEGDMSTISGSINYGYALTNAPDTGNPYQEIVLPVKLTDFSVSLDAKQMPELRWTTASEQNASYFEIERSPDGSEFTDIGQMAAHGTTSVAHNYSYSDPDALQGINYYRLRTVDLDGRYDYSKIISIDLGQHGRGLIVAPNPIAYSATLKFNVKTTGNYRMDLINMSGQVVRTQMIYVGSQEQDVPFSREAGLSSGIYILRAVNISTGESYEKKLFMQ
jgi:hypothetical protein